MRIKLIKILLLLVTAILLIQGGISAGIINGKDGNANRDNKKDLATAGDGDMSSRLDSTDESGEKELKDVRYETFPIVCQIGPKDTYYQYSNSKLAWYMIRNEEHKPTGCDDTVDITACDGYHIDSTATEEDKVMYLTFDCGYENGYTDDMLDVLKRHQVPACFFVTQTYIRDNVELMKRMKEEGHQVGNHTVTHPSMPDVSYEEIIEEVEGCADYMQEATGYPMDPYLRPPMGEYSERTLRITRDLGYETVFWSMAYMDYDVNDQPGSAYVVEHFEKYHHNGAIILMHNVSSSNAQALDQVLTHMKAKGYRFASLNELRQK